MINDVSEWTTECSDYSIDDLRNLLAGVMAADCNFEEGMKHIVPVLESKACQTELLCGYPGRKAGVSTSIEVLSLDLAWLRPGPFGTWSEQGQQACFCVQRPGGPRGANAWYGRALHRFFSSNDRRSLLTYQDIYMRQSFIQVSRLGDVLGAAAAPTRAVRRENPLAPETWRTTFYPGRDAEQTCDEWRQRFEDFRIALTDELGPELGMAPVSAAILVWVYVSPGASDNSLAPPPWAASLFTVFRFRTADPEDRDLDLLVSNLVHALRTASQTALPARLKHDVAQALAHEFKNLNQDIAATSQLLLQEFKRCLPHTNSPGIDALHKRLAALDVAAQASTAISSAAYWYMSDTRDSIEFRAHEEAGAIFRHVLYLAMHVIAAKHESWTLRDVPDIGQIIRFLDARLGMRSRGSVTNLLSNRCVSLMLFIALEPVRNVRAQGGDDAAVELWVETDGHCIALVQRSRQRGDANLPLRSRTVAAMMEFAQDHPSSIGSSLHIDPDVTTTLSPTEDEGVFVAERRTTIHVHKVPFPMS